jgi:hypothetical protein
VQLGSLVPDPSSSDNVPTNQRFQISFNVQVAIADSAGITLRYNADDAALSTMSSLSADERVLTIYVSDVSKGLPEATIYCQIASTAIVAKSGSSVFFAGKSKGNAWSVTPFFKVEWNSTGDALVFGQTAVDAGPYNVPYDSDNNYRDVPFTAGLPVPTEPGSVQGTVFAKTSGLWGNIAFNKTTLHANGV